MKSAARYLGPLLPAWAVLTFAFGFLFGVSGVLGWAVTAAVSLALVAVPDLGALEASP